METLDDAFFALSDPTRRALLVQLTHGESTVMELAQPFEMTQPAISRHLKVLENAGLITRRVDGARRPCMIAERGLDTIDQWLGMMRRALAANYDRLDDVLDEMQSKESKDPT